MAINPFAAKLQRLKEQQTPEAEVQQAVRESLANVAAQDALAEMHVPPEEIKADDARITDSKKLSQLVENDFPFDESQLQAIYGMTCERYACMTGAAGTGKTTTTKKIVDVLLSESEIQYINMAEYFKRGSADSGDDDDYEIPDKFIPAVALCSFTGKATQQIKKNFPRDWHGNIMTIHRLLAFVPEYYDDFDDETQEVRTKMRFTPTYNADCLLPWDIIIMDEAGMTGLELWHQLYAAMKPGCRIYMIGDINQLPPVHGRSIFGFAMANWPSFELTHIHRQKGVNNPIVDNAWRVLKGELPKPEGKFQMIELPGDAGTASRKVRGIIQEIKKRGIYEPNRDTIITAINGLEGSRGAQLGQVPLNNEFSLIFNPQSESVRYFIDAGRERKTFAVGDKVMATRNDHEAGITNGMTGIICDISPNGAYGGDHQRFGPVQEVNEYLRAESESVDDGKEFSLEEMEETLMAVDQGQRDAKDKRDRGPASHVVTVRFGEGEHAFEIPFATLSEVATLMTAYVVTCHKMQGGESPCIIIICHDAHRSMLYREWLYTAISRASQMCILMYSPTALRTAINKQNIKGSTLREKVAAFNALQKNNGLGAAVNVTIPLPERLHEPEELSLSQDVESSVGTDIVPSGYSLPTVAADSDLAEFEDLADGSPAVEPAVEQVQERVVEDKPEVHIHTGSMHVHETHIHVHVKNIIQPAPKKSLKDLLAKAKARDANMGWNEPAIESQVATPLALPEPETYKWHESESPYTPTMEPDSSVVMIRQQLESASASAESRRNAPTDIVSSTKPVNPWAAKLKALK